MSTRKAKKKETQRVGSGRPSFPDGLGTGLGKLWIFFILVIVLCVNVSYLVSIQICPPAYYLERVYQVSGADALAASFSQTMDGDGLEAELLERITPNDGSLPAQITLQSDENSDLLTIRVSSDNYYNTKRIMELFCLVYPEYAESAAEALATDPVSETESGADIILLFFVRTAAIGLLSGLAVCLIWLICYAAGYRKAYADPDERTDAQADFDEAEYEDSGEQAYEGSGEPGYEDSDEEESEDPDDQIFAPVQSIQKQIAMKCLMELPRITLWEGRRSSAQKMLITSRYADEDFRARISGFGRRVKKRMDNRGSAVLLVTSSAAGEGKSVVAANLALSLTQDGNSVILVETNFGDTAYPLMAQGPGLLDYAEDRSQLEDILCLAGENLVLITPGSTDGERDYAKLMDSAKISDLLAQLADIADYVILDTAPLLEAPETEVLLELADEVLYVSRADSDDQGDLEAGLKILAGAEQTVLGFVMNFSQEEA